MISDDTWLQGPLDTGTARRQTLVRLRRRQVLERRAAIVRAATDAVRVAISPVEVTR